ncbi:FAD-dependent oxidoreductase [Chloroflexota bacterium]
MKLANVKPISPVKIPQKWDYQKDVLVMGGGGSGLAAALGAVERKAQVIILEKASDVGGESAMAMNAVGYGSRIWQKTFNKTWTEDDLYEYIRTLPNITAFAKNADPRLLKNNLIWAAYLVDRLEDMGIKWYAVDQSYRYLGILKLAPVSTDLGEYSFEDPFEFKFGAVTRTLERWLRKQGVKFLLGTPATALITDDKGRVIGAQARTKAGKTIHIKAKGGVVDSTGGFSANRDMLDYYGSSGANAGCTTAPMTKMGDGIRLCQGVGASVGNMTDIDGAEGGITCLRRGTGNKAWGQNLYDATVQLARQPGLYVNKYGLRFTNEYLTAFGAYELLMEQPDHVIYSIFDADLDGAVKAFDSTTCKKPVTSDFGVYYNDDDIRRAGENPPYTPYFPGQALSFCDWHDGLRRGIEGGVIKVADTIEELAGIYGIDQKKLRQTVDEYNASYDRGKDNPIFAKDPGSLRQIRKPPFYGIEHGPRVLDTRGGVVINDKSQVVNSEGQPIPGLYAGSVSICGEAGRGGAIGVVGGMAFAYVGGMGAADEALGPLPRAEGRY